MDSFDFGVLALTIVVILLGLVLVYFTLRSFIKIWGSRGLTSGRSSLVKNLGLLALLSGIIALIHFWLVGGPNTEETLGTNDGYIEAQIGLPLVVLGIILTYLALPFRRTKVDKSLWPWPRRHKAANSLMLILVIVLGIVVYERLALRAHREDFIQARAAIDTVYTDIVAKVGQPDNFRRTSECSRPSQEFGQGPLSCSVGTDFIYGVGSKQQANKLFHQIQGIIGGHSDLFVQTQPLATSITDTLVIRNSYHDAQDYYSLGGLKCTSKYIYDTPEETYLKLHKPLPHNLYISLGCYGRSKANYY